MTRYLLWARYSNNFKVSFLSTQYYRDSYINLAQIFEKRVNFTYDGILGFICKSGFILIYPFYFHFEFLTIVSKFAKIVSRANED